MDRIEKTINAYSKNSGAFHNKFMDFTPYIDSINEFANILESGMKVLDLGCGPGNVTKQLLLSGKKFDILGVDLSQEMLKLARENVPRGNFICDDIREIEFPDNSFDVILLSFCIVHIEETEMEAFLNRISRYLVKQGKLYLSFMEGKVDGFERSSFSNDEIYFNYHVADNVIKRLLKNKFSIIKVTKQGYEEKNGMITTDVFIFAEKL